MGEMVNWLRTRMTRIGRIYTDTLLFDNIYEAEAGTA